MSSEAAILTQNPLLINKIVAERLSDKLQIMMVPADGKFFFANDVLRGMGAAGQMGQAAQAEPTEEQAWYKPQSRPNQKRHQRRSECLRASAGVQINGDLG